MRACPEKSSLHMHMHPQRGNHEAVVYRLQLTQSRVMTFANTLIPLENCRSSYNQSSPKQQFVRFCDIYDIRYSLNNALFHFNFPTQAPFVNLMLPTRAPSIAKSAIHSSHRWRYVFKQKIQNPIGKNLY